MVWIYEDPFTDEEQEAYEELQQRLKHIDIAKLIIKIFSLTIFMQNQNFSNLSEIERSAYFDKRKRYPVFNRDSARLILKSTKQRGGGDDDAYPFTNYLVIRGLKGIGNFVPDIIENPIVNLHALLTTPLANLKQNQPLVNLAMKLLHGGIETMVTTAADLATDLGGPAGAMVIAVFTVIVGVAAGGIALLENDFGQSVAHLMYATPFIGSALGTAMTKMERFMKDLEGHPTIASMIPIVSGYIAEKQDPQPLAMGGNRFSTYRHRNLKWQKTRRNKSAKT
jgi:hypothetical protein